MHYVIVDPPKGAHKFALYCNGQLVGLYASSNDAYAVVSQARERGCKSKQG